eukprot:TRINITY_DN110772_c0_g1_i1.p1 TRINITY_DN110772_c0_g1~~TRINITY_DN110772_c0_g1_i1.p1  ORF type:complete len:609 (-),score=103.50 TRINITY_DN110772_c0_g1_i1:386-2212(-)
MVAAGFLQSAGWLTLYSYVLLKGQTIPSWAQLRESYLFPGRSMALPVQRSHLPDWNVYYDWRANLPVILGLMGLYLLVGRLCGASAARRQAASRRRHMRNFGILFVVAMHGIGGAFLLALLGAANYWLAWWLASQLENGRKLDGSGGGRAGLSTKGAMLVIWLFNVPLLLLIFKLMSEDELTGEYRLLQLLPGSCKQLPLILGFKGLLPWHPYRFTCLKFISFACDAVMAAGAPVCSTRSCNGGGAVESCQMSLQQRSSADVTARQELQHDMADYFGDQALSLFAAYICYPPLYMAGPMLSYNAFVSQVDSPSKLHSSKDLAKYGLTLLFYCLLLETSLHVFYFPGWLGSGSSLSFLLNLPVSEIIVAVHWLMNYEWVSLLVVWRLQRFVALFDGVDTFENMTRNINFVCSFQDLWRHWNVSLNKFCIRYLYVPLGGKHRPLLSVFSTFIFIAFWHEVRGAGTAVHWYIWGVLQFFCVTCEKVFIGASTPKRSWLTTFVIGGLTYQLMMLASLPALLEAPEAAALGVQALASWRLLLPPMLFGLQAVTSMEEGRRFDAQPKTFGKPETVDENGRCSVESQVDPASQLRLLRQKRFETVSVGSSAANAA